MAADIVVGDEDGVAVVPWARIDFVLGRLATIRAAEADYDKKARGGLVAPDFIKNLMDAGRFKESD